jgi:predicted nucleotidyltransferase
MRDDKMAPLVQELNEYYADILKNITTMLKPGQRLIYAAITGSHAKNMNSPGSDYDCKCIIVHEERDYMLQKVKASRKFEYDEMLEGTFIDILTACKYALASNPQLYEAFEGIVLLETQASSDIKALYHKAFNFEVLHRSLSGMLYNRKKKKRLFLDDERNKTIQTIRTTRKNAAEEAYLALKIFSMHDNTNLIPPFDVFNILIDVNSITEEQRHMITVLIQNRKADKCAEYTISTEFQKFVNKALEMKLGTQVSSETKFSTHALQLEAEKNFLSLFYNSCDL